MKWIATKKREQNQAAVDPWTLVHLATGLAFGLVNVRLRWALAVSLAYEAAEQVFERKDWGQAFFDISGPESLPNSFMDFGVFIAGQRLGRLWNRSA